MRSSQQKFSFGQEVGSAEAAKVTAGIQRAEIDDQVAWRTAKKISADGQMQQDKPHEQEQCISLMSIRQGDIGYLDYWQFEVLQLVGNGDMLLRIGNPDIEPIWLTGFKKTAFADGEKVRILGLAEVKGTKSYTNALNVQKTVHVVRLLNAEERKAIEEKIAMEQDAKLFRNWTDSTGSYTFVGKFLEYKNSMVRLEGKDKVVKEMKLSQLSIADQKWISEEMKSRREAEKPAKKK